MALDDLGLPAKLSWPAEGIARLTEDALADLRGAARDLAAGPATADIAERLDAIERGLRRLTELPTRVVPLGSRLLALTHRGQKIFLDPDDIGITPHIALTGEWERETEAVLRHLLRPGQAVIEVGANMGYHTLAMGEAVGSQGRIHAFEANPHTARLLDATLQVNGYTDRVTLHAKAALAHRGEVEFAVHPDHCGSAHLAIQVEKPCYSRRVAVPAVLLDEEPGAALGPVDLIRMDAEGSEPLVLRGAAWLMARSPGLTIVTEWAPVLMQAYAEVGGVVDWLAAQGFRAARILPDASLQPLDRDALFGADHIEVVFRRGT